MNGRAVEESGMLRGGFVSVFTAMHDGEDFVRKAALGEAFRGRFIMFRNKGLDVRDRNEGEKLEVALNISVGCAKEELDHDQ